MCKYTMDYESQVSPARKRHCSEARGDRLHGGCKDEESNGVRAHVRQLAAQAAWMRGHPTDDVCPQRPDTVSRWEFQ